jgi:hypothetical protein
MQNFSNLMSKPGLLSIYKMEQQDLLFSIYESMLADHSSRLQKHLTEIGVVSDLYVRWWLLTLFTKVLPYQVALRVWDGYLALGEVRFSSAAMFESSHYIRW